MNIYPLRGKMSLFYLVVGGEGMILVDAGLVGEERLLWRQLDVLGRDDLQLIFITHAHLDHYGAGGPLAAGLKSPTSSRHRSPHTAPPQHTAATGPTVVALAVSGAWAHAVVGGGAGGSMSHQMYKSRRA